MNKFEIKSAAFAAALLCATAASAKTNTLDGNGFTVSYGGEASALSLSPDKSSVIFSGLSAGWFSNASESSKFTLNLDSGYSFSSLLVNAEGTYSGLWSASTAKLTSSINAASLGTLSDKQSINTSSFFSGSSWSLSKAYDLGSTSFATASSLNVSSSLALSTTGLGAITAQSYTVKIATAPTVVLTPAVAAVPEPEQWMMMLAGIGMIGSMVMLRSRIC